MANDVRNRTLRLSDLRRAHAADSTLENLLNTLSGKIQSCARLAVFAYEAGSEGHPALATAFNELADRERQSFTVLLACLREHLNEMPGADVAHTPERVRSDGA